MCAFMCKRRDVSLWGLMKIISYVFTVKNGFDRLQKAAIKLDAIVMRI